MASMAMSLILVAAGAILAFAVTTSVAGIELETAGVVLMVVGGVGLVLSMISALRAHEPPEREVLRERTHPRT
jgi:Domain of unknown function (DUF6458)